MSNLFTINKKENNKYINKCIKVNKKTDKHFPVSTREWNNSIYSFNRNTLSLIPISSKISSKLIRDYLKASNLDIRYKLPKTYLSRKKKRLTSNRIYVSNGEFKHTNDKVLIVLYTYNREKYNYIKLLANKYLFFIKRKKRLKRKFYRVKTKILKYLKRINKRKKINKKYNIKKILKNRKINLYMVKFYKKWLKRSTKIIKKYLYIKQLLYINSFKYNYTYLQILKNSIEKIQNKKVEFNLINIKYNYLNSDILLKSVSLKITKNRKKYKFYLNVPTWKIKTIKNHKLVEQNLNNIEFKGSIKNMLKDKIKSKAYLKKTVLENIEYKLISGIRFQVAGRLTKRIKAARAIKTVKYKGNLKNKTISISRSKVILRGNLKPNIQYTKLKSKTRIGSFGIKGWVSGN